MKKRKRSLTQRTLSNRRIVEEILGLILPQMDHISNTQLTIQKTQEEQGEQIAELHQKVTPKTQTPPSENTTSLSPQDATDSIQVLDLHNLAQTKHLATMQDQRNKEQRKLDKERTKQVTAHLKSMKTLTENTKHIWEAIKEVNLSVQNIDSAGGTGLGLDIGNGKGKRGGRTPRTKTPAKTKGSISKFIGKHGANLASGAGRALKGLGKLALPITAIMATADGISNGSDTEAIKQRTGKDSVSFLDRVTQGVAGAGAGLVNWIPGMGGIDANAVIGGFTKLTDLITAPIRKVTATLTASENKTSPNALQPTLTPSAKTEGSITPLNSNYPANPRTSLTPHGTDKTPIVYTQQLYGTDTITDNGLPYTLPTLHSALTEQIAQQKGLPLPIRNPREGEGTQTKLLPPSPVQSNSPQHTTATSQSITNITNNIITPEPRFRINDQSTLRLAYQGV